MVTKYSADDDESRNGCKPLRRKPQRRRSVSSERVRPTYEEHALPEPWKRPLAQSSLSVITTAPTNNNNNNTSSPLAVAPQVQPLLMSLANDRLARAELKDSGDPTPVIMAFTLIERFQYKNVVRTAEFESSVEYRSQPHSQAAPEAITDDQLRADMDDCKEELTGVCAMQTYLRSRGYHVMVWRKPYKQANCDDSLMARWIEPYLSGYYYKLVVDLSRSRSSSSHVAK